jgi:diguanylate cyclase (GGDEF)-like protein/PAS domain S-box-containing protein
MAGFTTAGRHARPTLLVTLGCAVTFASGTFLAGGVYLRPLLGLVGIALILTVVGRQLVVILEGESQALILEREVAARTAQVEENEVRFRSLVEASSDVIMVLDAWGVITFLTPSIERVLGFKPEDFERRALCELVHADDVLVMQDAIDKAIATDAIVVAEWRVRTSRGAWAACESSVRSMLHEPSVNGVVVNSRDISERKALEAQLIRRALHDTLTGLANQALLVDRVQLAIARNLREPHPFSLLLVDLDDFKAVNDGLGHAAGDQVLTTVARRLVQAVRPGDTVARLGGDEFAVLLDGTGAAVTPEVVAQRIQDALRQPMLIDGHEVFAPASIGLATSDGADEAEQLMRNADAAMYIAKGKGKSLVEVYRPEMHNRMKNRLTLASELRRAVSSNQFSLRYQPIVDLKTSRIVGFEALVRWRHPDRGLVMPIEFIELAENTGSIVPLGKWVFAEACRALSAFHEAQSTIDRPVTVTVNLSARQFADTSLVDDLAALAAEAKVSASSITLELTETMLMEDTEGAINTMLALRRHGFRLALDDFGTGYSSLSYLRRLPLDVLKIDKSFVTSMGSVEGDGMIDTILRLGETFRLSTLAEGIELDDTLVRLRELGCTYGQGYLFAEPIRRAAAVALLADQARHGLRPFWTSAPPVLSQ